MFLHGEKNHAVKKERKYRLYVTFGETFSSKQHMWSKTPRGRNRGSGAVSRRLRRAVARDAAEAHAPRRLAFGAPRGRGGPACRPCMLKEG